ncbi:MAG: polyprenyl synthetase family protein [Acidobacteriota bacterium]
MTPAALHKWTPRVERTLESLFQAPGNAPPHLVDAMRYSVMAGGKRIRPVLAMCAYELCGGRDAEAVLPAAAALECFHTYSLIHDDLPAMDNDDLRRGKPTNHKVYGEAAAILAGDALQTLAAWLLVTYPQGDAYTAARNKTAALVLYALGHQGMAGGQALDLEQTGGMPVTLAEMERIHDLKTGRLLQASLEAGGVWAGAGDDELKLLAGYGRAVGLAFQVVDDILDVTSNAEALGKTPGKDAAQDKNTFPAILGLEASRKRAEDLLHEALNVLAPFGDRASDLCELAHFVVHRDR